MIVSHEMASSTIAFFDRVLGKEPATGRTATARIGLSRDQVKRLTATPQPKVIPSADEIRRSLLLHARAVRATRAGAWGRKGMPDFLVSQMYAEYQRGSSCTEVARIYGGTRQSVFDVFKSHHLPLRQKQLNPKIDYRGRAYTWHKGYYRATEHDRQPLHHAMWIDAHGPVPAGHQVTFRNADARDVRLDNLLCAPIAEVTRYHRARHLAGAQN